MKNPQIIVGETALSLVRLTDKVKPVGPDNLTIYIAF